MCLLIFGNACSSGRSLAIILASSAGVMGVPLYLFTRSALCNDIAALLMVLVMLPLFASALYEKDAMPLEAFIGNYIRVRF